MTDVILVKPQTDHDSQGIPPLGLGFICSAVKKAGYTVRIVDCHIRGIPAGDLPDAVDLAQCRLLGFQAFHMDLPNVRECVRAVRERAPDLPIIVGGAAPSSDPEFVMQYIEGVNYLCVGEGEQTITALLGCLDDAFPSARLGDVPNLCWRGADGLRFVRERMLALVGAGR
jgi:radical SAM superfamily enzyme YgiQ (UPF0313 family)